MTYMSESTLVEILRDFVIYLGKGCFLNETHLSLLPILLHSIKDDISICTKLFDNEESKQMTGLLYKQYLLNHLLGLPWQKTHLIIWMAAFREIVLTEEQLDILVKRILR
jgi:hypothetical protein